MMQLTGASKNSLERDLRILKQMGWVEFHGSRKNGYFVLTAKFPGLINSEEMNVYVGGGRLGNS